MITMRMMFEKEEKGPKEVMMMIERREDNHMRKGQISALCKSKQGAEKVYNPSHR